MRHLFLLAGAGLLALASPATAQNNPVNMGFFVTVSPANVPDYEEAAREHMEWHADQNDPTPWVAYQAVTGPQAEYVVVGTMDWSALDNPPIDGAADAEHWANGGARYVDSQEVTLWTPIPDSGNPPADPTQYPVVQVFEFEITPGKDFAVTQAIRLFKEAIDASGAPLAYAWSSVVSADTQPGVFLAIWSGSFAALGAPGGAPIDILASHFGAGEAGVITEAFSEAASLLATRIYAFRPDLSHLPM